MQYFNLFADGEPIERRDGEGLDETVSVGLHNEARESGYRDDESGPLSWLNSARVVIDPGEDSVTFCASLDDPRGALTFTLRRKPDGGVIIHLPHQDGGLQHVEVRELHLGTLEVGQWVITDADGLKLSGDVVWRNRNTTNGIDTVEVWHPADRSDPEPEWMELIPSLSRETCVELLNGLHPCEECDTAEELRNVVVDAVQCGDLAPSDLER